MVAFNRNLRGPLPRKHAQKTPPSNSCFNCPPLMTHVMRSWCCTMCHRPFGFPSSARRCATPAQPPKRLQIRSIVPAIGTEPMTPLDSTVTRFCDLRLDQRSSDYSASSYDSQRSLHDSDDSFISSFDPADVACAIRQSRWRRMAALPSFLETVHEADAQVLFAPWWWHMAPSDS